MYCTKCKAKNDNNSKYCRKCGELLKEEIDDKKRKRINNFLLIGFIISFFLPPIGLIISLVSVVISYNYINKYDEKIDKLNLGISGIILSIFFLIIYAAFITILLKHPNNRYDNNVFGKYECGELTPSHLIIDNGYFDVIDGSKIVNVGEYSVEKREIKRSDCVRYNLKNNPSKTFENYGMFYAKKILITNCNKKITITFDDYKVYNCIKE